jgi:hypothetical protein
MKASAALACVFLLLAGSLSGAEFTSKVVDGLGRPVAEADFHVRIPKTIPNSERHGMERLELRTDAKGIVSGRYDEKSIPNDESVYIYVAKKGYESYSTELRAEYVLREEFSGKDVRGILRLREKAQRNAMKRLLAGRFEPDYKHGENESLSKLAFDYEHGLRPPLRSLVSDSQVGVEAARLLAFIGDPEDLRLVIRRAPEPKKELFEDRWAYDVASALLEPATDREWAFLKKCAANEFDDGWVDFGAIQSLRLIASPRSVQILKEVQPKNSGREETIEEAIRYVQGNPAQLSDEDLMEARNKVAKAIKIGRWEGNQEPKYNADENMALIRCEFVTGRNALTYTATFHRVGKLWKLRGVRETMQALMALPAARETFLGVWHGYYKGGLGFGRLELNDNGQGLLALSELPDHSPPYTYRVLESKQHGSGLDMRLEPISPDAEPVQLKNIINGIDALELEVQGEGWSQNAKLFKEQEFDRRAEDVKKSLEKLRSAK